MKITTHFFFTIILSACLSSQVTADIAIGFSTDNGSSFTNDVNVQTGDLVAISIFLSESGSDTVLANDGLLGFGLAGTASLGGSGTITDAAHNPIFDFSSTDGFSDDSIDWEALALNNTVPTGSRILLGSFDFQTVADGSSTFEFGDIQPGSTSAEANWLSGAGAELDEMIFGTGASSTFQLRINVTSVPEPASSAVLLLGSLALVCNRRRSR